MPTVATVDDYIAAQPIEAQPRLWELRAIVRAAIPQAAEVISYGIPTYKLPVGIIAFGAAKRHCALYGSVMEAFAEELRGYDTSKGSVRFPLDKPIPEELVRRLVLARIAALEILSPKPLGIGVRHGWQPDCAPVARSAASSRQFRTRLALARFMPDATRAGCNTYGQIARAEGQFSGFHNCTAVVCVIPE